MNASKLSAFISGFVTSLFAIFLERLEYNFIWLALVFFPLIIIYAVGFEIWREWAKGENIGSYPIRPLNAAGVRIFLLMKLRMFIFFFGGVSAIVLTLPFK